MHHPTKRYGIDNEMSPVRPLTSWNHVISDIGLSESPGASKLLGKISCPLDDSFNYSDKANSKLHGMLSS